MSTEFDRLKAALAGVVRASLPAIDFFAMYRARVVAQGTGLDLVDVTPDDPRIPSMASVPLVLPAGVTVKINIPKAGEPPTFVLIGWSGGDPSQPFAVPFAGAGVATKFVVDADQIFVGGELGAEPALKGESFASALSTFLFALTTYAGAIQAIADPSGAATTSLGTAATAFGNAVTAAFAAKTSVA